MYRAPHSQLLDRLPWLWHQPRPKPMHGTFTGERKGGGELHLAPGRNSHFWMGK